MENSNPSTYGPPNWATGISSTSLKSPASSPLNNCQESPDFSPFSYSSPVKYHSRNNRGGRRRYFNNSSGNFSSPNNQHYYKRRNRGNRQRFNNDSSDTSNISVYFHPSMLQDPWEELEKQLKESDEANEKPSTPEDLNNDDTSVQN